MASYTENYGFKKPASTDKFAISDYNDNLDMIDTAISSSGGGTSCGSAVLMTQGTVAAYGVATVPESEEV